MPGTKPDLGSRKNLACWVKTEKSRSSCVYLLILIKSPGVSHPSWDDQSQALLKKKLSRDTDQEDLETPALALFSQTLRKEKEPVSGNILATWAVLVLGQMYSSRCPSWCH